MEIVHTSVLGEEVLHYLAPKKEKELLVDCTLGEGGHSWQFLSKFPDLRIIGVDTDESILEVAKSRLAEFQGRIEFRNDWFNSFLTSYDYPERPDSILLDLGISIFHYSKSSRGFSFQKDESLDMRLSSTLEVSAGHIINNYSEEDLANLIFSYGEERYSRRIARSILATRQKGTIVSTRQLADIVWNAVPPQYRHGKIHPATKTFQALRIVVNGELVRLKEVLEAALRVLNVGGRIAVISFHSLEDRIVKNFFRDKSKACTCPPEVPICKCEGKQLVKVLTKKPVVANDEEVAKNPPSRSAKLRVVEKLEELE